MTNTYTLPEYISSSYDGMLVIADVHGDYESFMKARTYARGENLFLMSLGDLVDRGNNPFEVVKTMHSDMQDARAGFTVGNHDDKFVRYAKGANVKFSRDGRNTLDAVGESRMQEFLDMYTAIAEDTFLAGLFHQFSDITLVHAASHPSVWENPDVIGKTAKSRFLVGETTGKLDADGYPERLYNWVNEIPMGKTVIVGHDRMPIHNKHITEPMIVTNTSGGKVVFLDTGCGKGGFLSGAVVSHSKSKFNLENFMEFK